MLRVSAPETRDLPSPSALTKKQAAEVAVDDGGDTRKGLGSDAHNAHQTVAPAGVLRKIHRRADTRRYRKEERQSGHGKGIDQGGH